MKTYAPELRVLLTRDHLSAVAGVTSTGKVCLRVQEASFSSPSIIRFLKHLVANIAGKITVIWDGLPAHRSKAVKAFLAQSEAQERLWVERLPSYAPDVNPIEGLWAYLKRVELRNQWLPGLIRLWDGITAAVARIRHRTGVVDGFIRQVGYESV